MSVLSNNGNIYYISADRVGSHFCDLYLSGNAVELILKVCIGICCYGFIEFELDVKEKLFTKSCASCYYLVCAIVLSLALQLNNSCEVAFLGRLDLYVDYAHVGCCLCTYDQIIAFTEKLRILFRRLNCLAEVCYAVNQCHRHGFKHFICELELVNCVLRGPYYDVVMKAIHYLADEGIKVNMRVNFDWKNIDRLSIFFREIKAEFGNNDNISLYIAPLFQVQHTDSITDLYRSVRRYIRTVVPVGLKNAVNITA